MAEYVKSAIASVEKAIESVDPVSRMFLKPTLFQLKSVLSRLEEDKKVEMPKFVEPVKGMVCGGCGTYEELRCTHNAYVEEDSPNGIKVTPNEKACGLYRDRIKKETGI